MNRVAERHPNLTMVIDHLGVSQSPVSPPRADNWDRLDGLLGLAKYPNVHVKFSGAPVLSREPYPHHDIWPYLHKIVDAFTPDRLMWGTDFTRLRSRPVSGDLAPREDWHLYSDSVNYLRDTTELSASDKEKIFGLTIRRVLRWPKPAAKA
jgi:predicted TIM-barrel fold metal-dependent hydrolase